MHKTSIRPLEEVDALTSVKWRNDPTVWVLTSSAPDRTVTAEDEAEWIVDVMARPNDYRFAILMDEDYVGNIYLTHVEPGVGAEYHIFIGEKAALGRGVAHDASLLLIEFARTQLRLRFIELTVRTEHERALRLYGRLGFRQYKSDQTTVSMRLDL